MLPRRIVLRRIVLGLGLACGGPAGAAVRGAVEPPPSRAVPARAPPVAHLSPDRRYAIILDSDLAFGQVETLRVSQDPTGPRPRIIFEQSGDTPFRFVRWRDARTAILELLCAGPPATPPAQLLLTCGDGTCVLQPLP